MSDPYVVLTSLAFVSGMIASDIKDWRLWIPFVGVAGFVTGLVGYAMGVR